MMFNDEANDHIKNVMETFICELNNFLDDKENDIYVFDPDCSFFHEVCVNYKKFQIYIRQLPGGDGYQLSLTAGIFKTVFGLTYDFNIPLGNEVSELAFKALDKIKKDKENKRLNKQSNKITYILKKLGF